MAGRTAASVITRYAGIQVQSSSLGVNIPVGWGTFRCKCNLVDYLDFTSKAQKAASGKGGQTTTGYSYTATIILAICEGLIDAVTQVWVNGKRYANGSNGSTVANTGSTSACAQVGLSLALGAIGQVPWSYLTSVHPSHAIGYSGLANAFASNYALDSGASTPNHSFEVVRQASFAVGGGYTGPDIDPSLMLADFFQNTRTGVPSWGSGLLDAVSLTSAANSYQKYCLAAGLLLSPVIDQQRSASDFVTEVLRATNSNVVWSEGLLKFIPYGDTALTANGATYTPNLTPVYALNDDSYIVDKDGDPPLLVDIQDQSDAYNVVQCEYLDRTNQYNMAIALASDAANVAQYGMRRKDPDTVHVICTPSVAAMSAQLFLQRTLYIRAQYKFKLGWMYALLEPGDLLTLTDAGLGLAAYPVRIVQIDEDEKYGLTLTCEDLLVGVSHAPLYTMANATPVVVNQGIDPGGVEANLLLQSQDWTNATWVKTAMTVTAAATTDPITGASDAQSLIPTNAAGTHNLVQNSIAIFSGANYTYSAYLKADGYNFALLRAASGSDGVNVVFDLGGGVVNSSTVSGTGVLISSAITSLGSGWYLCAFTFQISDSTLQVTLRTGDTAAHALSGSFTGNGTSGIFAWGAQLVQGVDQRPYTLTTTAISGPQIFQPPSALTPGGVQTWAALAGGPNWGGANVWVSYDGTNFELVGSTQQGPARSGTLTASLASHADPDTVDTLSVDLSLSNGALTSASQATTDASGTLCLVDNELIGFEVATLTGPNRYDLTTYLRRGMLNTAIASHSSGAPFIRLDSAIFAFPYNAAQAGKTATVKFQSLNLWGGAATPLSNCNPYTTVPIPAGGAPPGSTAWTVTAITLSSGGQSIPALHIVGKSDNLSASAIEFFYRPTGTSAWLSAGFCGPATTQKDITSIQASQTYDVAVAYLVNGILTPLQIISGGGTTTGGSGSGNSPGNALLNDSVAGAGKTFTCPAGSYTHVDIILTGFPGPGNGTNSGGKGGTTTDRGGGGAGVTIAKGFPVTAGTTVITYTLPSAVGSDATATATGLSLTSHPGTSATTGASGTGGAASTGNTATGAASLTAYAGHNGGLTDVWDGGGPGATIVISSGTVTNPGADNVTLNSVGAIPGQGGSGDAFTINAGGGANLLIIART